MSVQEIAAMSVPMSAQPSAMLVPLEPTPSRRAGGQGVPLGQRGGR